MHNFAEIVKGKDVVEAALKSKFPEAKYTTKILLWDDGTYEVECRHGINGEKGIELHIFKYYNEELSYKIDIFNSNAIKIDEKGREYYTLNNTD